MQCRWSALGAGLVPVEGRCGDTDLLCFAVLSSFRRPPARVSEQPRPLVDVALLTSGKTSFLAVGTRAPGAGAAFVGTASSPTPQPPSTRRARVASAHEARQFPAGGREDHPGCVQVWAVKAPASAGERAQKRARGDTEASTAPEPSAAALVRLHALPLLPALSVRRPE